MSVHKVGLAASVAGTSALALASFGRIRPFRLATGEIVSVWEALPTSTILLLFGLWVAVAVMSLIDLPGRRAAMGRGILGSLLIAASIWASGVAAYIVLEGASAIARYSMGAGVWLSVFAAFALVVGSRREVGASSGAGVALSVLAPGLLVALVVSGRLSALGIAAEYRNVSDDFWVWVVQHVAYAGSAMAVAVIVGTLLGILAFRHPSLARPVFGATSIVQTIPGLAMVGLLAVPLGLFAAQFPAVRELGIGVLGWAPVVIALTLYALLIVVRNTYVGLMSVPAAAVEAGRGMGMAERQLLTRVQLPLASPVLFSGTRTALQQTVGNATLAYFVAAGGLGRPTFGGVSQQAADLVVLGSIALVVLALVADTALRIAEYFVTPHGAKGSQ